MDKKKKILITIIIFLFILIFFLTYLIFTRYSLKNDFENSILSFANKNDKIVFQINKIVLFSNCDAKNKNALNSGFTIENLYQYTDIAIFINTPSEEKVLENTLKKANISNIKFITLPSAGTPKLYFKSFNNFSKSELLEDNLINETLEFNISSEDTTNLDIPTLYNNLANPITLSYINSNIKSDYTITDITNPITYDGSLLKKCKIPLSSLNCNLSFDINITNNLDQEFKTTIFIDIPIETESKSIYDGNVILNKDVNFIFYR